MFLTELKPDTATEMYELVPRTDVIQEIWDKCLLKTKKRRIIVFLFTIDKQGSIREWNML